MRRLTLRTRVTLVAGSCVLVAVATMAVATWWVVRRDLVAELDQGLSTQIERFDARPPGVTAVEPELSEPSTLFEGSYVQVLDEDGEVVVAFGDRRLPVTRDPGELVGEVVEVTADDGDRVRVLTAAVPTGGYVQVGRSLDEVEGTLGRLRVALSVLGAGGIAAALVLGRVIAASAARPIRELSGAADAIARTGDPDHPITVQGDDEVGQLAASFNAMLDALSRSLRTQRQLVADASHELRTPLASVRTNIEVLRAHPGMDSAERDELLADVVGQLEELGVLVHDIVEVARSEEVPEPREPVDLLAVARAAAQTVRGAHPGAAIAVRGTSVMVVGMARRLERAITNLVDNAVKWSPPGGAVEVAVDGSAVRVRDRGPGVDPTHAERIFDRFWRAPDARGRPGSGLGLALVKQVADDHAGRVDVETPDGGGALFTLRLPSAEHGMGPGDRSG